jgi:hypothetical protein
MPDDASPTTLVSSLKFRMKTPHPGLYIQLTATLTYEVSDPFAVSLAFDVGEDVPPVVWIFSRGLLLSTATAPGDEGDVQVWTAPGEFGKPVLNVAISSPFGHAHFETEVADIQKFVDWTASLVPFGEESSFADIDSELAGLLGGS